jgi:hypothetical protein
VILDGEVAMLQAQVERLQEQLTESDHDRIANIARLTGQVARLHESIAITDKNTRRMHEELTALRDFKVMAEAQQEDHNGELQSMTDALVRADAQRDELQGMLTACEEERDAANERIAVNEKLLATRDELLAMFDCPAHGACVPHAKEEVTRLRVRGSRHQGPVGARGRGAAAGVLGHSYPLRLRRMQSLQGTHGYRCHPRRRRQQGCGRRAARGWTGLLDLQRHSPHVARRR